MSNKRLFLLSFTFGLLIFFFFYLRSYRKKPETIGGQRDEYGCLGPAGYAWDKTIQACLRTWELDEDQKKAAQITAAEFRDHFGLTVDSVQTLNCPGCFTVVLSQNTQQATFVLENWQVKQ